MDTYQRYEALLKIQNQLNDYSAYFPEWKFRLHGNKDLNLAMQDLKKIIALAAQELLVEEAQKLNQYFESPQALDSNNLE